MAANNELKVKVNSHTTVFIIYYRMFKKLFESVLLPIALLFSAGVDAQDGGTPAVEAQYIGVWKGNWLEGMSSGGVTLEIAENGGQLSFSGRPAFGTEPEPISKIKHSDQQLGFQTTGADGGAMRFELKPTADYQKLKGKAYYQGLHMEVEINRVQ